MTDDREVTIRQVLREYPVDHERVSVDRPLHAMGFSGALIVRVRTGDATYCLRRWPSQALPRRRLVELHRFLRLVHREGLDCLLVPIASLDGDTLVECDRHLWQLEPWMPGVADYQQTPTDERLDAVMRVLARLHNVAARYEPTDAGCEWFQTHLSRVSPAIGERMTVIDRWTSERLHQATTSVRQDHDQPFREAAVEILDRFRKTHVQVRAELQRLAQSAVRLHPCLRDVWHDHVLFTGDEVTGLIDLAATRTETVATDLSRLLGSLLGDMRDERWGRALETYEQVRSLSLPEHQLIRVLHVSGVLLSGMTWIDCRITGSLAEQMLPRVVERMHTILRALSCCQTF